MIDRHHSKKFKEVEIKKIKVQTFKKIVKSLNMDMGREEKRITNQKIA